jgi:hypothetical protein
MDLAPVISLGVTESALFAGTEENGLFLSTDNGANWQQLAPRQIPGAVPQIFVDQSEILVVTAQSIYYSPDIGKTMTQRWVLNAESEISSVAIPYGLAPEHPLWIGLVNGKIQKI